MSERRYKVGLDRQQAMLASIHTQNKVEKELAKIGQAMASYL
jgi:hypothetical protein